MDQIDTRPRASAAALLGSGTATFWFVFVIVAALTIVRLAALYTSKVDLFFDEAQYWAWSRDLSFGYFSKPPLLAWLIAGAGAICGDAEACVRAPSPLLFMGASLAVYAIGAALYDARTAFWAAMLTAFGTGAVFAARIVSTDVPLLFFWALALLAYAKLLNRPDWRWAVLLGVALGGGILSKYAMLYFIAGMLIAAMLERQARAPLMRRQLWLALGVAAVLIAPNLVWNAAHGFLTVHSAVANVAGEPIQLSITRPLEFLASQFGVFGPVVFGVALVAFATINSKRLLPQDRILLAFAVCPLLTVIVISFAMHVYANWAAASFVSLAVLAAAGLVRQKLLWLLRASLALGVAAQLMFVVTDAFATSIRIPFFHDPNPYAPTIGWATFGRTVGELARKHQAGAIAGERRAYVATLLYYWRDQPEQVVAWQSEELPESWPSHALAQATPQPILFVTDCPDFDRLGRFYSKVTPLGGFVSDDPVVPRFFHAVMLAQPRGPIGPIAPCRRP